VRRVSEGREEFFKQKTLSLFPLRPPRLGGCKFPDSFTAETQRAQSSEKRGEFLKQKPLSFSSLGVLGASAVKTFRLSSTESFVELFSLGGLGEVLLGGDDLF
jgi:hypothetical protein